jgi:hypothetical protein
VHRIVTTVIAIIASFVLAAAAAAPADANAGTATNQRGRFQNCDHLHNYWPHGVGRRHAHDKTSGTPVTNFKRSNRIYENAMDHNPDLDRDKDKIACEAA